MYRTINMVYIVDKSIKYFRIGFTINVTRTKPYRHAHIHNSISCAELDEQKPKQC